MHHSQPQKKHKQMDMTAYVLVYLYVHTARSLSKMIYVLKKVI